MKPEIKALWLKALRSGEYKQARGYLQDEGSFCCLGVLCDLHAKAGLGTWDGEDYLLESKVLPIQVQEWAGLIAGEPVVSSEYAVNGAITLSGINDNGVDFNDIAHIIERDL